MALKESAIKTVATMKEIFLNKLQQFPQYNVIIIRDIQYDFIPFDCKKIECNEQ